MSVSRRRFLKQSAAAGWLGADPLSIPLEAPGFAGPPPPSPWSSRR